MKPLDDFVDVSIRDEMTERLAERDFFSALRESEIRKMTREERFCSFCDFAEHGLENLVLRPDAGKEQWSFPDKVTGNSYLFRYM